MKARDIFSYLSKYNHASFNHRPNALLIPVTKLVYNDLGVAAFNKIYKALLGLKNYSTIKRTSSGGISFNMPLSQRCHQWDIRFWSAFAEITIIDIAGMWRIQLAPGKSIDELHGDQLSGRKAYFMFTAMLKKDGINLEDYAIKDGQKINALIEKPLIETPHPNLYMNREFNSVHHIDFHNSYPAGLVNTHPEFKKTIEYLYNKRKTRADYKDILNYTIGFMHSKFLGWKYSHLARDSIADNNKRVRELAERLIKANRNIILYNVDGIWYQGDIYHGSGEGEKLGEWHNDHINCKFRMKSVGAYEFIENDSYYAVVRGLTNLDKIKPRESWEWGDIYKQEAEIATYKFVEGEGFINEHAKICK